GISTSSSNSAEISPQRAASTIMPPLSASPRSAATDASMARDLALQERARAPPVALERTLGPALHARDLGQFQARVEAHLDQRRERRVEAGKPVQRIVEREHLLAAIFRRRLQRGRVERRDRLVAAATERRARTHVVDDD